MGAYLVQIHCQQWEKSQRGEPYASLRHSHPDRTAIRPIQQLPHIPLGNGQQLRLDIHGDDRPSALYPDGRFRLKKVGGLGWQLDRVLFYQQQDGAVCLRHSSGEFDQWQLHDGWLQYRYQQRYRVEESDALYWLYEQVVINLAYFPDSHGQQHIFIENNPGCVIEDNDPDCQ